MSTPERSKATTEALHRVTAARNNVAAVLAGAWPAGEPSTDVLRSTVEMLDRAAEWLEGEQ